MSNSFSLENLVPSGTVKWRSPSNIAIVKYWGKHGLQLPRNPSFSLTLSQAYTETSMRYRLLENESREITVALDGQELPGFVPKINAFFDRLSDDYPFLNSIECHFETHNSFPHSSGIASSASAMSAIALCIAEITRRTEDLAEISRMARLGSGSACRSIFPHGAVWGESDAVFGSSDRYAIGVSHEMHPVFQSMRDSILIVRSGEKSVSSTAGHQLMEDNPYADQRYAKARNRMHLLMPALASGDVITFGQICEEEALELHALMMCSQPPYILMEPGSIELIRRIQDFRAETHIPVYFTLDAGPNIHLLYPDQFSEQIVPWIESELAPFCENGYWINDQVGKGPAQIFS